MYSTLASSLLFVESARATALRRTAPIILSEKPMCKRYH